MQLILSKTNDDANTIGKTVTDEFLTDIYLRGDFDIVSPIIKLKLSANADALQFNYCQMPALNRYYFIDEVQSLNNGIWQFMLSCDVLETYKAEILASNARFMRSIKTGDYFNATLQESIFTEISTHESNKQFSGEPSLILATIGG